MIYASFFEWYWHKYWMHQVRPPKEAFRGHTVVHHGVYKGDDRFFLPDDKHPNHILLKPYALPAIILAHLPILLLIEKFWIPNVLWGAMVTMLVYFVIYEYMHWNMHVPRKQFVERFHWFQFLRSHHKLHHQYYQVNFCVLFPLADWVMGTLETETSFAKRKKEREESIAKGIPLRDNRGKRRKPRRDARQAQLQKEALLKTIDKDKPRILPTLEEFVAMASSRKKS